MRFVSPTAALAVILIAATTLGLVACGDEPAPQPTADPSPAQSDAEAYLDGLVPIAEADIAASEELVSTPLDFNDQATWDGAVPGMETYLSTLKELQSRVEAISPPAGFEDAHQALIDSYTACYEGNAAVLACLSEKSTVDELWAAFEAATADLSAANEQFRDAVTTAAGEAGAEVPAVVLEAYPSQ